MFCIILLLLLYDLKISDEIKLTRCNVLSLQRCRYSRLQLKMARDSVQQKEYDGHHVENPLFEREL